jgi:hypothetical protein
LIAERLAASGWKYRQSRLPGDQAFDDLALARQEFIEAEVLFESI